MLSLLLLKKDQREIFGSFSFYKKYIRRCIVINNFKLVKELINPIDVAHRYLGNPIMHSGKYLFYKSPFRLEERTASFSVTNRGFHDFGISKSYDIFNFVSEYFKVSIYEAFKILVRDFNIQIASEKIDKETYKRLQLERDMRIKERENRVKFFNTKFNVLCDEFHNINKVLEELDIKDIDKITNTDIEQMEKRDKLDYILEWFVNNDINLIYDTLSEYNNLKTNDFIDKTFNKLMCIDLRLEIDEHLENDINNSRNSEKEEEDER